MIGETAGLTSLRLRMPATKCRHEGKNLLNGYAWVAHNQFRQKKAGISRDEHGGGEAQKSHRNRSGTHQGRCPACASEHYMPRKGRPRRGGSEKDMPSLLTGRKRQFNK